MRKKLSFHPIIFFVLASLVATPNFGNAMCACDELPRNKQVYYRENPYVGSYSRLEMLNSSGLDLDQNGPFCLTDYFFTEDGQVNGPSMSKMTSAQEKAYLLGKLHAAWDSIIYHCDEATDYAEKLEDNKVADAIVECIEEGIVALGASKKWKTAIVMAMLEFTRKFSIKNCYYYLQVVYHLNEAEKSAKEWDAIFDYMKEKKYL